MLELILRNGQLITPTGVVVGDLGVESGKIVALGSIVGKAKQEIDCTGRHILPGAIDVHVHFRDPGFPHKGDFESESRAAAAGGVTTVFDMPNTDPPTTTLKTLEEKREIAAKKSHVNFGLYMGLTDKNLEEIKQAKNIAGVKIYMGSSTGNLLVNNPAIIEDCLQTGRLAIIHAESEALIRESEAKYGKEKKSEIEPRLHSVIRGHQAAYQATREILHLAKKHDARIHITHVSTAQEIEEIKKFKSAKVSCDVTPHHLFLTVKDYERMGNFAKVNPPLRDEEDRQALWQGIRESTVDCVATDHAPHIKEEKQKPYWDTPSGMPGVQFVLPLLLNAVNHGELTLQQAVKLTSENPARLFAAKNKGKIEIGFDADLVVVDMDMTKEVTEKMILSKCGWSPYSGRILQGWPMMTLVNGHVAFEDGKIMGETMEPHKPLTKEVKFDIYR